MGQILRMNDIQNILHNKTFYVTKNSSYTHFFLIKQKLYEFQFDVYSEKIVAFMYNFNSDKYCVDFCMELDSSKKELTIKFAKRFIPEPATISVNKKNEFIDNADKKTFKTNFLEAMQHKFKNLNLDFSENSCVGTINYVIIHDSSVFNYVNRPKDSSFENDNVNKGYKNNKQ